MEQQAHKEYGKSHCVFKKLPLGARELKKENWKRRIAVQKLDDEKPNMTG